MGQVFRLPFSCIQNSFIPVSDCSRQNIAVLMLSRRVMLMALLYLKRRRRRQRSVQVKPFFKRRDKKGEFCSLYNDLHGGDHEQFTQYFRMEKSTFNILLDLLKGHLTKINTNFRKAITAEQRLALTLRFLGHGDPQNLLCLEKRKFIEKLLLYRKKKFTKALKFIQAMPRFTIILFFMHSGNTQLQKHTCPALHLKSNNKSVYYSISNEVAISSEVENKILMRSAD